MKKENAKQSKPSVVTIRDLNKGIAKEKKRQEFLKKLRERY